MIDSLFFVGSGPPALLERLSRSLTSEAAVHDTYARCRHARWIVMDSGALHLLKRTAPAHDRGHRLLLFERTSTARRELLHALFRVVVAPDDGVRLLPPEELVEVIADERAEDLFIGGLVNTDDDALVLYRGNLDRLIVPFTWFKPRPKSPRPNFNAFDVTDFGQTIQLGDYEASADAILYEFDADARRRMKARAIKEDQSFGGALRRLRLARSLSRSDFEPGVSAKTIARIERREVAEPHGETLAIIAKRLGVKADEISSY